MHPSTQSNPLPTPVGEILLDEEKVISATRSQAADYFHLCLSKLKSIVKTSLEKNTKSVDLILSLQEKGIPLSALVDSPSLYLRFIWSFTLSPISLLKLIKTHFGISLGETTIIHNDWIAPSLVTSHQAYFFDTPENCLEVVTLLAEDKKFSVIARSYFHNIKSVTLLCALLELYHHTRSEPVFLNSLLNREPLPLLEQLLMKIHLPDDHSRIKNLKLFEQIRELSNSVKVNIDNSQDRRYITIAALILDTQLRSKDVLLICKYLKAEESLSTFIKFVRSHFRDGRIESIKATEVTLDQLRILLKRSSENSPQVIAEDVFDILSPKSVDETKNIDLANVGLWILCRTRPVDQIINIMEQALKPLSKSISTATNTPPLDFLYNSEPNSQHPESFAIWLAKIHTFVDRYEDTVFKRLERQQSRQRNDSTNSLDSLGDVPTSAAASTTTSPDHTDQIRTHDNVF